MIASGGWQSTQPYLVTDPNIYRQGSERWLARGYAVAMVEHTDGSGVFPATKWSPLTLRSQIRMPVLVGHANNDKIVLVGQTKTFCVASGAFNCRAVYLTAGKVGEPDFTHANVNDAALANFRATEQSFVCAVVWPFTGPCT